MTNDGRRKVEGAGSAALALACCALFALAAADARAQPSGQAEATVDSLLTKAGPLSLVRVGEESDLKMELRLGGKKLGVLEVMYASFVAHFRELTTDGEVVVMSVSEGGTACPAQFQIIRVEGAGKASVTDEFGDCSDSPTIILEQLPREQITLRFPGYYRLAEAREPGFRKPPPTTWLYSKGVLQVKAPAPSRRGQ
ncbi:MAG TPA: hypothetical protein VF064_00995 [Pyrinomonadaceae bacterium]